MNHYQEIFLVLLPGRNSFLVLHFLRFTGGCVRLQSGTLEPQRDGRGDSNESTSNKQFLMPIKVKQKHTL